MIHGSQYGLRRWGALNDVAFFENFPKGVDASEGTAGILLLDVATGAADDEEVEVKEGRYEINEDNVLDDEAELLLILLLVLTGEEDGEVVMLDGGGSNITKGSLLSFPSLLAALLEEGDGDVA